jgi:hypothetical protein
MPDFLNPIAELNQPDSGKIVSPEEAYKIKDKYTFYCPDHECKDPKRKLTSKKSSNGNYFFSHNPRCSHDIFPETLLHKLAIKWFLNQDKYELPRHKSLNGDFSKILFKEKTEAEFRLLKRIIPDVKLFAENNFEFAIEIVVTNDITAEKAKLIKEFKLPTVRVSLEDFYEENRDDCRTNMEFINANLPNLLTDIKRKSWAIPPDFKTIDITCKLPRKSTTQD